ncbi:MAG: potassium-transporting ATPase subunit KdpC [Planctomycetes bacterium]|nr:potassium-transporting ATPase subunit KdpC [Planctomycetota bacterium]
MKDNLRPSIVMLVLFTLILGLGYPAAVTGVARVVFPSKSTGSTIERDGKVVGSELVGQSFDDPKYFWGRPSATSPANNGAASSGSNLGPTAQAQADAVAGRVKALQDADPTQTGPVPADLVTASGSGLDPHISPEAALYQVHRVAAARGMTKEQEADLKGLVERHVEGRTLGFMGEPRVNVLMLNLDLDGIKR